MRKLSLERYTIAFVSAVFAVVLYVLLPIENNKYTLKQKVEKHHSDVFAITYADLDNDSIPELIRCKSTAPAPAIVIENLEDKVSTQINLEGEWVIRSGVNLINSDHDDFMEIVVFTYFNDSIWLNLSEPLQKEGLELRIPVARTQLYNHEQDWVIHFGEIGDLTGDGAEDLVFSIISGLSLEPRSLYVFDISENKLLISHPAGTTVKIPQIIDLDGDGVNEITGSSFAAGNYRKQRVSYPDTCAWLMVFQNDLDYLFEPLPFDGRPSYLDVLPLQVKGEQLLISNFYSRQTGFKGNTLDVWKFESDSLRKLKSRRINSKGRILMFGAGQVSPGSFYIGDPEKGIVQKCNYKLEIENRKRKVDQVAANTMINMDIDRDNVQERILCKNDGSIAVYRNNFAHPACANIGFQKSGAFISSYKENRHTVLSVYRNPQLVLLSYSRNQFYPFRHLVLFLSFIGYYLIFSLILRAQKKRIESRLESERTILQYQLTNVMQQLDPHFLFNSLSNISSHHQKGEQAIVQSYITKISRLFSRSLANSEKVTISLEEELEFVQDYLTIEQLRMQEQFSFYLEIGEHDLDGIQIPKMLVQIFVENAIKHGIRHLQDKKGIIIISTIREKDSLRIRIRDNGIGRQKAKEIKSFGSGRGMQLVQTTLDVLERMRNIMISFEIEDLYDNENKPDGTLVLITIPYAN